jgi:methionyl-tRNA formyltransferase
LEPPTGLFPTLPLLDTPAAANIVELAWERGIPALEVGRLRDPSCRAVLEPYQPDVLCVSCFPQILPGSVLQWPRLGGLNLHPSLLPAYRGPSPLFWQFRHDEERAGVTVHIMDTGADSGDILLQEAFPLEEGITGAALTRACARRGARLMAEALRGLAAGTLTGRKQPPGGSYYSWPAARDFEAPTTRPARWAYNFIRGVSGWGAVTILAGDRRFVTREAIRYEATGALGRAYECGEGWARIQLAPGVLEVLLAVDTRG